MSAKLVAMVGLVWSMSAHPIHSTLTVVTHAPDGSVKAMIRVFADDWSDAVGQKHDGYVVSLDTGFAVKTAAYLERRFVLSGKDGRRIRLAWCGVKQTGEVLWLCVGARSVGTLRGATVSNAILLERFSDQVNIVQVSYDGRRQSLLFTRAEAPKRLP